MKSTVSASIISILLLLCILQQQTPAVVVNAFATSNGKKTSTNINTNTNININTRTTTRDNDRAAANEHVLSASRNVNDDKSTCYESEQTQKETQTETRRSILHRAVFGLTTTTTAAAIAITTNPSPSYATKAGAQDTSDKYAPKFVQTYEDFVQVDEGWQYKDVKVGGSSSSSSSTTSSEDLVLEVGDRAVFDWSGYTIGYFGRPFEAKGGPQGGAFDKDVDYSRTVIGSGSVVPGVEKALMSMKPGGVRQVIIPYGELSYPADDLEHTRVGPKPTTFSGQRALNFVLENPRVDRTLLFNIKLVRIDKANGKGGFIRG